MSTAVKFKEFIKKYERHIGLGAIALGFVWDSITLARPDQIFGNIILVSYLLLSAGGILLFVIYEKKGTVTHTLWLTLVQFAFGNLAGGFLVIYGKSGTFEGSFLFLLILGALIVGNEFLREKYQQINFNVSVWFFLLLSYLSLIVPVVLGRMGDGIFLLSGAISLAAVALFLTVLYAVSPQKAAVVVGKTIFSVAAIFAVFNYFYFSNIIPPVPLSIREVGIYHSVEKLPNGNYRASYEKPDWYDFWRDTGDTVALSPGDTAYCFSSVFAPVGLSTGINHVWEYYDDATSKWRPSSVIAFPISGGRDNGYRGYSQKSSLTEGKWRCSVETTRGALIGRTTFTVDYSEMPPKLSVTEL